jgi:cytochrome c oxidase assembly factor CtaG
MPSPWSWDLAWEELLLVGVASVAYSRAYRREPVSRARVFSFGAGMGLAALAVTTPLATLATHYLLVAHLLQNVVLAEWAPALVVLGLGPAVATEIARAPTVRILTQPLVSLPLWVANYGLWHVPVVYEAGLRHSQLLVLEHVAYFGVGVLFWWPVFQAVPRDVSSGAKAAYLFAAFVLASPLGLLFALLPDPIYAFYEHAPRIWGLDPLEDQQLGGILMAGSESIVFFGACCLYFFRFVLEES